MTARPDAPSLAVVGAGRLGRAVATELGTAFSVTTADRVDAGWRSAGLSAMVLVDDGPDHAGPGLASGAAPAAPAASTLGVPWTPVRVELGTVIIGPTVTPGLAGCATCADTRRERTRTDADLRSDARKRFPDRFARPDPGLTSFGIDIAARLTAGEVSGRLAGAGTGRLHHGTIRLNLDTLAVSTHRFIPDPHCADCGWLPEDTREGARIELRPAPKARPDVYRVRNLFESMDSLIDTYVDPEHGLIRTLQRTTFGAYPTMMAPIGLPGRPVQIESGSGRDLDFRTARLTAITEAVERHGGVRPGGKRTVVRGSHRELADRALDPRALGLYPDERYALPDFAYQRYHEDLVMPWVWGYSFGRQEPILVPESCAYYRLHLADRHVHPFVYEISNGCALGGCLEEAILHGIVELAERDAFLLTWYARLPVRRLDLNSARDRTIPLMADRLRRLTGYDIHAFDTTTEHGIPTVWVMAVHPGGDERAPKAVCAAGAGFQGERAVANALLELAPILDWRRATYPDEVERARRMVDDPAEVRSMHDHSVLYSHPLAFDRFGFLFDSGPAVPIDESFAEAFHTGETDLRDDLLATMARYLDRGLDVVVVDQTAIEQRAGGFRCVKVLIPGLLPMTFGHWARRVDGLPRLFDVPYELGYRDGPLRAADVNPHPHPFP